MSQILILNSRFTDKTKTTANHTDLLKVNGDELRILLGDGLDHFVSPLGRQGFRILEDGPDVGRDEKEGGGGDVVDRGRGVGSSDGGFGAGPDFRRIFLVGVGGHCRGNGAPEIDKVCSTYKAYPSRCELGNVYFFCS